MIKCAIIDDEPLARECVENYATEIDFLEVVGTGSNPIELTRLMEKESIDLVFMDIQMPVMNGIDFLRSRSISPMVILTTAYPSYALEGYELDVLDYLVKPITFNRFFQAIGKARDHYHLKSGRASKLTETATPGDFFYIRCNNRYEKILIADVLFIQAQQNYVTIVTEETSYMTLMKLSTVADYLKDQPFIQVHKSFLVSIPKVDSLENHEIRIGENRIPVSRTFRKEAMDRVLANKVWKG